MEHQEIIAYFRALDPSKQKQVLNNLLEHLSSGEENVFTIRESKIEKTGLICPNCKGNGIVGYGKYKNVRRFKCKDCCKTFNSLTGSVAHKIHKKELLKQYLYFMLQGHSLRKIAGQMDICLKTAFDWRHKILNSIKPDDNSKISGVIEADETFFLYSEKGNKNIDNRKARRRGGAASKKGINNDHVTVLTAYERKSGNFTNTVVCRGRITKKAIDKGLGRWLNKEESILCTDSHKSFEGFALDNRIVIKRIFVRRKEYVVEKIYHIQNVNNIHSNLKRWVQKFNGVATKYLQNYMNYYNLVKSLGDSFDKAEKALSKVLQYDNVYIKGEELNQQNYIT